MCSNDDEQILSTEAEALQRAMMSKAEAAAKSPVMPLPASTSDADELLATTCLWEIAALRRHYHPAVSLLAKVSVIYR